MKSEIRELIKSITVDKSNFEYIGTTRRINGTLSLEIERVLEEYGNLRHNEGKAEGRKEGIGEDLDFLNKMKSLVESYKQSKDITVLDLLDKMIQDWIDELLSKLT